MEGGGVLSGGIIATEKFSRPIELDMQSREIFGTIETTGGRDVVQGRRWKRRCGQRCRTERMGRGQIYGMVETGGR